MPPRYIDDSEIDWGSAPQEAQAPKSPSIRYIDDSEIATPSSWQDTAIGALKGIGQGAMSVVTAPADLLYRGGIEGINLFKENDINPAGGYPSDRVSQFYDWVSGGRGDETAEAIGEIGTSLATAVMMPSKAATIASKVPFLGKAAQGEGLGAKAADITSKAIGYGTEGALLSGAYGAKSENLGEEMAQGGIINTLLPASLKGVGKIISPFSSSKGARMAQDIAEDLRKVVPDALTETKTAGQRITEVAQSFDEKALAERKAASALFEALPDETATLEPAIGNIKSYAEKLSGPIVPGSKASNVMGYLERLRPADKVMETAPSKLVDEMGNPLIPGMREVIPGGPAKVPLNQAQNILRDIGTLQQGSEGAERAILRQAKGEVLESIGTSVSPEAKNALTKARSAWREMMETYEDSAVGKVRESLSDPEKKLSALRNALKDPKQAEQLAKVMDVKDLANTQSLMLNDLLRMTPVSWEREIAKNFDSYRAIFGEEGAGRLLAMVSRDGTIGKKLLQDNNGLRNLLLKVGLAAAIPGVIGYQAGGVPGMLVGGFVGAKMSAQGKSVNMAKSLLMRAAAGSDEALEILNTPIAGAKYPEAIGRLGTILTAKLSGTPTQPEEQELSTKKAATSPTVPSSKNTPFLRNSQATSGFKFGLGNPTMGNISLKGGATVDLTPHAEPLAKALSGSSVDPEKLLVALIKTESTDRDTGKPDPKAVSPAGAKGLMQLMPAMVKNLGVKDVFDPEDNIKGGVKLLVEELSRFKNLESALAAYNAGSPQIYSAMRKAQSTNFDDYKKYLKEETQEYVPKILRLLA